MHVRMRPLADHVLQDTRHGLRALRRQPLFTLAAVTTLALAIGAGATVLSVVEAEVWRPLPFPRPDRLVAVSSTIADSPREQGPATVADFLDWRETSRAIGDLAAFQFSRRNVVRVRGAAESITTRPVTPGFFETLGVRAALGQLFDGTVGRAAEAAEVVLTDRGWRRLFQGDPGALGTTLVIGGVAHTVKGILDGAFRLESMPEPDLFVRLAWTSTETADRDARLVNVIGRLRPGETVQTANNELQAIARRLELAHPASNQRRGASVAILGDRYSGNNWRTLFFFLGVVVLVFALSVVNVSNLLLARTLQRRHEFVIRTALGGARSALFRQLFIEGLLIVLPASGLGLLVAAWSIAGLQSLLPADYLTRGGHLVIDATVLAAIGGAALVTAVLFGLVPGAFVAKARMALAITSSARTVAGSRAERRARRVLVLAQVAIALVLVFAAGLFVTSFVRLTNAPLGFDPTNRLTARLLFADGVSRSRERLAADATQLLERVGALPGVRSAALASSVPFRSGPSVQFRAVGRRAEDASSFLRVVTDGYFATFGIEVVAGRGFTDRDVQGAVPVAVVNETLVQRFFRGEDPVGQTLDLRPVRILPEFTPGMVQIVGVVRNTKHVGVHEVEFNGIYLPFMQHPVSGLTLALRTTGPSAGLAEQIRSTVRAVDPSVPVDAVATMDQMVDDDLRGARFHLLLTGTLAVLAVVLAAAGIYGVMTFTLEQRTREFGLRLALGAEPRSILSLALGESASLGAIGTGLGLVVSLIAARLLGNALYLVPGEHSGVIYGVSVFDLPTLGLAGAVLIAIALVSGFMPARHATRIDPMVALRND